MGDDDLVTEAAGATSAGSGVSDDRAVGANAVEGAGDGLVSPAIGHRRNPALDGCRGIAIVLVVLCHANIPLFHFGGTAGLTLFFVLSGYLITSILLRERDGTGRVSFGAFYARRALRLLPALVVAIAGGVVLMVAVGGHPSTVVRAGIISLFYGANLTELAHKVDMTPFGDLWSLSMEEQYYLIWPAVLMVALRFRRSRIVAGLALVGTASVALRFVGPYSAVGYRRAYYLPHTNVWALLVGSALALVITQRALAVPRWSGTVGLVGLTLVATVMGLRTGLHETAEPLTYFLRLLAGPIAAGFALLLVLAAISTDRAPAWLTHPILLFFGKISYGLYLWHAVLGASLAHKFPGGGVHGIAVGSFASGLAVIAAVLSNRYIEAPFLRRKVRFERTTT